MNKDGLYLLLAAVMEYDATLNIDGSKVRSLREEQELTQLYLATAVGVTTETISRWERRRYPSIKRANGLKLAEALNVPLEMLLETPSAENKPVEKNVAINELIAESRLSSRWLRKKPLFITASIILSLLAFRLLLPADKESGIGAVRYLPAQVMPGQPFPVLIRVERVSSATSFLLRENLADLCAPMQTIPPSLTSDSNKHQLKWVNRGQGQGQENFYYLAMPDDDAPMESLLSFHGYVVAGRRGSPEPKVTGTQQTRITPFHWADENRDNRIDNYEMLSVYELFPKGEAVGIDIKEIETIWAAPGYRWDGVEAGITILSKSKEKRPPSSNSNKRNNP